MAAAGHRIHTIGSNENNSVDCTHRSQCRVKGQGSTAVEIHVNPKLRGQEKEETFHEGLWSALDRRDKGGKQCFVNAQSRGCGGSTAC